MCITTATSEISLIEIRNPGDNPSGQVEHRQQAQNEGHIPVPPPPSVPHPKYKAPGQDNPVTKT